MWTGPSITQDKLSLYLFSILYFTCGKQITPMFPFQWLPGFSNCSIQSFLFRIDIMAHLSISFMDSIFLFKLLCGGSDMKQLKSREHTKLCQNYARKLCQCAKSSRQYEWLHAWFRQDITVTTANINTLRPRQDGRHFPDDIFKSIFLNENVWISITISLKLVPRYPINNIPALVQIMAWRRPGDKPLSEPMMLSLPTHICITRPQWVKFIQLTNDRINALQDILVRYARYQDYKSLGYQAIPHATEDILHASHIYGTSRQTDLWRT